jgi:hypothetical protein
MGDAAMTRVIVAGTLANKPGNGGEAWVRLTWVLGLRRLGFDTYFVEQIDPVRCVDRAGRPAAFRRSVNRAYFRAVCAQFGLAGRAALVAGAGGETEGMAWADIRAVAESADLLVNISGHLTLAPLRRGIRRAVYLDIDPGFTQFWHADGLLAAHLAGHDAYFTIGANIGRPDCPIPTGDIRWRSTRPPVLLDQWPLAAPVGSERFTTVATWRGAYGPVEHGGVRYGTKLHEFRKVIALPQLAAQRFEIALAIDRADAKDLAALREHGWAIADPRAVAGDPAAFRSYVQGSDAEFSVAQGVYVATDSGWFSDRTVRYLASGKPALVQDTGFSRNYPARDGLVAFRTLDEAIAGAERIGRDYDDQCRAARALAEDHFDSDKVLGRLLEEVGIFP